MLWINGRSSLHTHAHRPRRSDEGVHLFSSCVLLPACLPACHSHLRVMCSLPIVTHATRSSSTSESPAHPHTHTRTDVAQLCVCVLLWVANTPSLPSSLLPSST